MTILHCFSHIADMRNFPPMLNLAQLMALSALAYNNTTHEFDFRIIDHVIQPRVCDHLSMANNVCKCDWIMFLPANAIWSPCFFLKIHSSSIWISFTGVPKEFPNSLMLFPRLSHTAFILIILVIFESLAKILASRLGYESCGWDLRLETAI